MRVFFDPKECAQKQNNAQHVGILLKHVTVREHKYLRNYRFHSNMYQKSKRSLQVGDNIYDSLSLLRLWLLLYMRIFSLSLSLYIYIFTYKYTYYWHCYQLISLEARKSCMELRKLLCCLEVSRVDVLRHIIQVCLDPMPCPTNTVWQSQCREHSVLLHSVIHDGVFWCIRSSIYLGQSRRNCCASW